MEETETLELLQTAQVGRLCLSRNDEPYVVPVNFAYENGHVYVHCAETGMKIDFVRSNPRVCFEIDERFGTLAAPVMCGYDTAYRSVIVFGTARLLTDLDEKTSAMRLIAVKYALGKDVEAANKLGATTMDKYRSSLGSPTTVIDITVERMSGKHYGTEHSKLDSIVSER